MKQHRFFTCLAVLALAALACNLSGSTDAVTQDPGAATQNTAGAATTGAPPAESGSTPNAGVTPEACVWASALSADVTVPDDTQFQPNTGFTKTWRMSNTGSCAWGSGTQLVFVTDEPMGAPSAVDVAPTAPGAEVEISVPFVSPAASGTHRSTWQMRNGQGNFFGTTIFVQIVVPDSGGQAGVTPDAPAAGWKTYRRGDQGVAVFAIQYLMISEGAKLTVDGVFGTQTEKAVVDFQQKNDLTGDGIVGPKTWQTLTGRHSVRSGSRGDDVRAVQVLLAKAYGFSLTVDGVFGAKSEQAVRDFQAAHGLSADGIVGPKTWLALISNL